MRTTVVVCTPSRGLVHSRTVAAVLAALDQAAEAGVAVGVRDWWVLTHDLPIPDAFNACAEAALATEADLVWFVEEDMEPPPTALVALVQALAAGADVAALDYAIGDHPDNCAAHNPDGSLVWVGLGCTLIRRTVFDRLPAPWFRCDVSYRLTWVAGTARLELWDEPAAYGGQDIHFSQQCREAGLVLAEVPDLLAGHLALVERGAPVTNAGCHTIVPRPAPRRWH